ncbi:MAG: serine hydrolase domain-containing protein [Verrucomicrobiota bacterium]
MLICALLPLTSGCQVTRALKQPIPASAPLGGADERTERIAKVVRDTMRKEGIPGLSIAVIDHGEVVWAQGFGWRDIKQRLPVDTNTQFQAASISKPLTALAILRMSASGKVDLDADVNRYLKGWHLESKFLTNPVTLRELLCHRAGTVPHGFTGFSESKPAPSLLDILTTRYFMNGPVKVTDAPGSLYRYSGGGYCVVQKAVEDVTGEPFELAMNELLLQPMGMERSHFHQPPSAQESENAARGYGWMKAVAYGGRWGVFPQKAAAGLWTTPADLARLVVAVQKANSGENAGPISPAIAQEFLRPQFDPGMGTGVFLDEKGDYHGFFHAGENLGYFARFGAGVSNGRGWVIMSNAQKDRFGPILQAVFQEFGPVRNPRAEP